MKKGIDSRKIKLLTALAVTGVATASVANATGVDALFEPSNFEKFKNSIMADSYDYVAGGEEESNLADESKRSDTGAGADEQQLLQLADAMEQRQSNEDGTLKLADANSILDSLENPNSFQFVDTASNADNKVNSGSNGQGASSGPNSGDSSNKGNNPTDPDNKNTGGNGGSNGGQNGNNNNQGDKPQPENPVSWEDKQLEAKDPIVTKYGQLVSLSAQFNKAHYSRGENYQAGDATVTATFLTTNGEYNTRELSYGGEDGYSVVMSTNSFGNQKAVFSYKGMSTRTEYSVLSNYVTVKYQAKQPGNEQDYYGSSFPGEGIKQLYGEDVFNSLNKLVSEPKNFPESGDIINMYEVHRRMIAYLGDTDIINSMRSIVQDSSSNITTLTEKDGYLINMLSGFRYVERRVIQDGQSYVYYPGSDWGSITSKNIINIVTDVPDGYKIRRETEYDDDILKYYGEQVLEGYEGADTTLVVPMGVTKIDLKEEAENVTEISIPQSADIINVESIQNNLPNLQSYSYANGEDETEGRWEYKIIDGILYSTDGKTLVSVPSGRKLVTIPANVTTLAKGCLEGLAEDAIVSFESEKAPKVAGETGFKGTIKTKASQGDAIRKAYCLALGNECNQIPVITEADSTMAYIYDQENKILCYKNEPDTLAGIDQSTAGLYQVPDSISAIGAYAFAGCNKLMAVEMNGNVKLQDNSFKLTEKIRTITLNGSGVEVSKYVFGNPEDGASVPDIKIYVSTGDYQSYLKKWSKVLDSVYGEGTAEKLLTEDESDILYEDGVKYQKTGKNQYQLVQVYETDKTVIQVKEGTTGIAEDALDNCSALEIIMLPDSLTRIQAGTFTAASGLRSVVVENSSLDISEAAGLTSDAEVFQKGEQFEDYVSENGVLYGVDSANAYTVLCVPTDYSGRLTVKENTIALYKRAFENCIKIIQLELPTAETLREIGEYCFAGCSNIPDADFSMCENLTSIGAYAFQGCVKMETLVLPDSIQTISEGMCADDVWLQSVNSAGCKVIEDNAFAGCSLLMDLTGMSAVENMGDYAFAGCLNLKSVILPETLQTIGEGCFENCTGLQKVELNGKLTAISRYCFYGCTSLKTINFSEQQKQLLQVIGVQAFSQCVQLETLDLSELTALQRMGERTFSGCQALTTVRMPETIQKIPDYYFEDCESLSIFELNGASVPELGEKIFGEKLPEFIHIWAPQEYVDKYQDAYKEQLDGVYGEGTAKDIISEINENEEIVKGVLFEITAEGRVLKEASTSLEGAYDVPADTIRIEADAFAGCQKVTGVTIPKEASVSLGDRCFKGCTGIQTLQILGSVPEWGEETFMDCTGIGKVYVGSGSSSQISRIGTRAFKGCTGLSDLYAMNVATYVSTIGEECFADCTNLRAVAFLMVNKKIPYLTTIEDRAFANCTNLGSMLTSNFTGLKTIGAYVFTECDSLKTPSIPANVTSIGEGCFMGCDNVTAVSFYGSLEEYPKYCFKDCPKLTKTGGTAAAFAGLKRIGEGAYEGCVSLKTDMIAANKHNWALERYTNLESIGANAFRGCSTMSYVNLSASVQEIGDGAFDGCSSLGQMTLNSAEPLHIGAFAMEGRPEGFRILVPDSQDSGDNIYMAYYEMLSNLIGKEKAYQVLDSVSDGAKERHPFEPDTEEIGLDAEDVEQKDAGETDAEQTAEVESEAEDTAEAETTEKDENTTGQEQTEEKEYDNRTVGTGNP